VVCSSFWVASAGAVVVGAVDAGAASSAALNWL